MRTRIVRFLEEYPLASRRRIFFVYGIALIIGTHIPRLKLGEGVIIAPDKLMHVAAFGGLAMLMMLSHFVRRDGRLFNGKNIVLCAVYSLLWGGVTEVTQQLFVAGRTASVQDVICNSIGIVFAVLVGVWLGLGKEGTEAARHQGIKERQKESSTDYAD